MFALRFLSSCFLLVFSISAGALLERGEGAELLNCRISVCHQSNQNSEFVPIYRKWPAHGIENHASAVQACQSNRTDQYWVNDSTQAYSAEEATEKFAHEYRRSNTSDALEDYEALMKTDMICYPVVQDSESFFPVRKANVEVKEIIDLGNDNYLIDGPVFKRESGDVYFATGGNDGICNYFGFESHIKTNWEKESGEERAAIKEDGSLVFETGTWWKVLSVQCKGRLNQ